jgi:hypothetical protein
MWVLSSALVSVAGHSPGLERHGRPTFGAMCNTSVAPSRGEGTERCAIRSPLGRCHHGFIPQHLKLVQRLVQTGVHLVQVKRLREDRHMVVLQPRPLLIQARRIA